MHWRWKRNENEMSAPLTRLQTQIKMKRLVKTNFFGCFASLSTKKRLQVALIFSYLPSHPAGPLTLFGKLD